MTDGDLWNYKKLNTIMKINIVVTGGAYECVITSGSGRFDYELVVSENEKDKIPLAPFITCI
jgi:hypothetical protein